MTKDELDAQYKQEHNTLEDESFTIIDGKRVLVEGLSQELFDQRHRQLWIDHEDRLIAANFMAPRPERIIVPPRSTHFGTLEAINVSAARPARIKRVYQGIDFFYDCFVTESIKDEYVSGGLQIGDYVLVHFDDSGEQVITHKIFKSW